MNKYISLIALAVTCSSTITMAKPYKEKSLPPGLEKKLERTGELPPGWEKKLQVGKPMDIDVYRHSSIVVPVGRDRIITVKVEDKLVRLFEATREIVEILD